jgi:hypothetical protein
MKYKQNLVAFEMLKFAFQRPPIGGFFFERKICKRQIIWKNFFNQVGFFPIKNVTFLHLQKRMLNHKQKKNKKRQQKRHHHQH